MIKRKISKPIKDAAKSFPIIGILGPRQSGKTTLAQLLFPNYKYVNLEVPENRRFAESDPQGFLLQYPNHTIIDEVQRVPSLFSYLQVKTDQDKIMGQYILTGSQHFLMLGSISQTLAGRIALFNLYPLSYDELKMAKKQNKTIYEQIWKGGYPRLYDQKINVSLWFSNYVQTYLERDISLISHIENLRTFENFLHLSAGRSGQLLNLSSLANDAGVSHNTIKSWINLLETSGIIFLLKPYHTNINKRMIKTPKLYFVDTGLLCYLLGITASQQLPTHPLYGSIFETFIASESLKNITNNQKFSKMYFWRNREGLEADLLIQNGEKIDLIEIKSSQTIPNNIFGNLLKIRDIIKKIGQNILIYAGTESQKRSSGLILPWNDASPSPSPEAI